MKIAPIYKSLLLICFMSVSMLSHALFTAPSGQTPANNSTDQVTSPKLSFPQQFGLDGWVFEFSKDTTFTTGVTRIKEKYYYTYAPGLEYSTKYFWRGRYYNNNDSSHWSAVASFVTTGNTTIANPSLDSITTQGRIYLAAHRSNLKYYEFFIDTTEDFSSPLSRRIVSSDTGFTNYWIEIVYDSLYFDSRYYYKMRAYEGSDTAGWSPTQTFYSSTVYLYFKILSKRLGTVELNWSMRAGITKYLVQLDVDTNFNTSELIDTFHVPATGGASIIIRDLDFGTNYYWRVKAINALDTFIWSEYNSFKTDNINGSGFDIGYYVNTELTWRQYFGTNGTQVQIDTTPDFNSPYLRDTVSLYDTSFNTNYSEVWDLKNLFYGKKYFTRMRVFHSKDTTDWLVRTRTTITSGLIRYPFPNDVFAPGDSVTFDSNSRFGNYFRIQIDTVSNFSSSALFDTIILASMPLQKWFKPQLEYDTKYYWRIQVGHELDTSRWSDYQSTRTFQTVSKPTLNYPYNNWKMVADISPEFRWDQVEHANYQFQLDTSADFNSSLLIDSLITNFNGKLKINDLYFNSTYHWRVRLVNGNTVSPWSDPRYFFTADEVRNLKPKQGDSTYVPSSIDWSSIQGTTGFIARIDTLADLSTAHVDTLYNPNAFFYSFYLAELELLFDKPYYYQISLFHSKDTLNSVIVGFKTRERQAPNHVSPANKSTDVDLSVSLKWNTYPNANGYLIEYSENADFSDSTSKYITTTTYKPNFGFGKTYYWRVRAMYNDIIVVSDYSAPWKLSTLESFPVPKLTSPANNAIEVNINTKLKWQAVNDATSYVIDISTFPDFSGKFTRNSSTNELEFNFSDEKKYYWRVRYKVGSTASPWSETWNFTTDKDRTSISDITATNIKIYPVPTTDKLIIDCAGSSLKPVSIVNMMGETIMILSESTKASLTEVDISLLSNGVYSVLLTDGLRTYSKLIIKE